jgi:hypothetical protein
VVTQGSVQVSQLTQLSDACSAKGAKPIIQQLYPSSAETLLAIANGRGDAFLTAGPQGVYISRINTKVALVKGEVPNVQRQPAGIARRRASGAARPSRWPWRVRPGRPYKAILKSSASPAPPCRSTSCKGRGADTPSSRPEREGGAERRRGCSLERWRRHEPEPRRN